MKNEGNKTDNFGEYWNIMREYILPLEEKYLKTSFFKVEKELDEIKSIIKQKGLLNPHLPLKYGGQGKSLEEFVHISRIIGQSPIANYVFGTSAPDAGNMELLLILKEKNLINDKITNEYLNDFFKGEVRSCFGMTEKDSLGSKPTFINTYYTKTEKGYILNGDKWFCTGAQGAKFCILFARSKDKNQTTNRYNYSLFLVPTNNEGFNIIRNIGVMGHVGNGLDSHAELSLKNCEIPKENLIGIEGEALKYVQLRLAHGRIHHCSRWLGICERSLRLIQERLKNRSISKDQFLSNSQIHQVRFAELLAEYLSTKELVLLTARKVDQKITDAPLFTSLIKFKTANILNNIIDYGIQVYGAMGVSDDTILAYFYRMERAAKIYDGPNEVHKIFAGKEILNGDLNEFFIKN